MTANFLLNAAGVVSGFLIALFLPGYLLCSIIPGKLNILERICLSIGLSIAIVVSLGFNLTAFAYLTGARGITAKSAWASLLAICIFFCLILIIAKHNKTTKKWILKIVYGA